MKDSEIAKTKEQALTMLRNQIAQNQGQSDEEDPAPKLALDSIEQILEREWVHQFDDDRATIIPSIREIVEIAIDQYLLENR